MPAGNGVLCNQETLVFLLCELFNDIAFADAACALNQDAALPAFSVLPIEKSIVDFALHKMPPH